MTNDASLEKSLKDIRRAYNRLLKDERFQPRLTTETRDEPGSHHDEMLAVSAALHALEDLVSPVEERPGVSAYQADCGFSA